jgi:5-methylcytosine-specific restriction endonuclease McrA
MSSCIKTEGWLLGKQRQLQTQRKQYEERVTLYNKNPKLCKLCKAPLPYKLKQRGNSFCNQTCSATYNNTQKGLKSMKTLTCVCGKQFICKSWQIRKYCSIQCHGKIKGKISCKSSIELFLEGKLTSRNVIKKVMYALGIKHQCQICGISEWQGKPLPMILDHINGRADNNMPDNLRLICSNCDSQTDHYKGKNKGNGRKSLGLL